LFYNPLRNNKNGKEIFYRSLDEKIPLKPSPNGQSMEPGNPTVLFPLRTVRESMSAANKHQYAVSSDGQRFLADLAANEAATPITLIYNWKPQAPK
jgi:hypothetical protein